MMSWIFCSGLACNTTQQVREIAGNYKIIPVYAKSLLDMSQGDPRLVNLQRISHAYISSRIPLSSRLWT
jgi:hypothetical protein